MLANQLQPTIHISTFRTFIYFLASILYNSACVIETINALNLVINLGNSTVFPGKSNC